jgi:short-subunit dehydrogenase involved in D-alanine esterification of teichoic acids
MPCKDHLTKVGIPDLSGYVVIVTGGVTNPQNIAILSPDQITDIRLAGNSGIGYQTTLQLALHHARVYISSRSEERVNKAIDDMKNVAGSVELDLRFLQMDLQNLRSVKAAAASFRQRETRLDLVINNAGV